MNNKVNECRSLLEYLGPLIESGKKHLLYRGERKSTRPLIPKVGRVKTVHGKPFTVNNEKELLNRYKKRLNSVTKEVPSEVMDLLMTAQHHGLPTRLLDFTTNPLVALFFAVERASPLTDGDSVVYLYDDPKGTWHDTVVDPFAITANMVISPRYAHQRMYLQQSRFIVVANPDKEFTETQLTKVIIKYEARKKIKQELNICGVNRMNLFNDIDSMAEFIEWGMTDCH